MFKWIAKIKITFQIIGIVVILLIIFMIAIGLVVKNNVDDMSNALMEKYPIATYRNCSSDSRNFGCQY